MQIPSNSYMTQMSLQSSPSPLLSTGKLFKRRTEGGALTAADCVQSPPQFEPDNSEQNMEHLQLCDACRLGF